MPLRVSIALRVLLAWVAASIALLVSFKFFVGGMGPSTVVVLDWVYAPLIIGDAAACLVFPFFVARHPVISISIAVIVDLVVSMLIGAYGARWWSLLIVLPTAGLYLGSLRPWPLGTPARVS